MGVAIVGPAPSDFLTVSEWVSSLPAVFTEDEVCALKEGWHGDPDASDHRIYFGSSIKTSANARLVIRAARPSDDPLGIYGITEDAAHRGVRGAGAKVATLMGSSWAVFNFGTAAPQHILVEDLNFVDPHGSSAYACRFTTQVGLAVINRCIFDNTSSTVHNASGVNPETGIIVVNSLGVNLRGSGFVLNHPGSASINCTFLGKAPGGTRTGVRYLPAYNTYAADFGNGSNGYYNIMAAPSAAFRGNAANDSSSSSVTADFRRIAVLDAFTPDYFPQEVLALAGVSASSIADELAHLPITSLLAYDITKRPRPSGSLSIGAFEASTPASTPVDAAGGFPHLLSTPFAGAVTGRATTWPLALEPLPVHAFSGLAATAATAASYFGTEIASLPFAGAARASATPYAILPPVEALRLAGYGAGRATIIGQPFPALSLQSPVGRGTVSTVGRGGLPSILAAPFHGIGSAANRVGDLHVVWQLPFWVWPD